jgi:hypothetical protein
MSVMLAELKGKQLATRRASGRQAASPIAAQARFARDITFVRPPKESRERDTEDSFDDR